MKKNVVVAGLGLIGGSMAMALKQYTDCTVYGWNRTRSVAEKALERGAIDGIADEQTIASCDLLIPVLYPEATVDFLLRIIPTMKPGARIVDLVGVKTSVIDAVEPVAAAHGIHYTGGHPMAGLEVAGFDNAFADLFRNASMILVPTATTAPGDVEWLSELFLQAGFGMIRVCDKKEHDRMIAHTSQMCHVVSNCYVKSPSCAHHKGFSAGSYRDMTRVAALNEIIWAQLFMANREALLEELNILLQDMTQVRDLIQAQDMGGLLECLKEGRLAKEAILD